MSSNERDDKKMKKGKGRKQTAGEREAPGPVASRGGDRGGAKGKHHNHHNHHNHHKKKNHSGNNGSQHFDDHMPVDQMEQGLQDFSLFSGRLKVFPNKRKLGYVEVEGLDIDVLIEDEQLRNRAMVGDIVVVRLSPESKWLPLQSNEEKITNRFGKSMDELNNSKAVDDVRSSMAALEVRNRTTDLWRPREDLLKAYCYEETVPNEQKQSIETPESQAWGTINEMAKISKTQPTGRVVGILATSPKGHTSIAGALTIKSPVPIGASLPDTVSYCTFKPANASYPHFIVPRINLPDAFRADPNSFTSHIFLLDAAPLWPASSKFPYGENVRSMGEVGTIQAETTALLVENDLNHSIFSDEILESLNDMLKESSSATTAEKATGNSDQSTGNENWVIPEEEIAKRLDLRSTRIFTIDPPNAKDLDDALHITPLPAGSPPCCSYEVGVHIADVSYFVREGTPLDVEALNRATSVYLVQKVIPMLPPLLCEQLCSLNPNVDRLAFSCIFRMTDDGCLCPKHETFFGKTVIRSCAKLDYHTAQRMVDGLVPTSPCDGGDGNEDAHIDRLPEEIWETRRRPPLGCGQKAWEIARDVQFLHKVAMPRRAQRLAFGALSLNNPKVTFRLDADGNPTTTSTYEIKESNQLIEEYMLLANYLVAEKLVETVGRFGFLRCHPPPDATGLESLVALASKIGYHVDISSAHTLQESLKEITATAPPLVTRAITSLMMLPMTAAEYFVIDQSKSESWKHYALAIPYYTHFTSPIRRYADVMVHRFLLEGLKLEKKQKHAHPTGSSSISNKQRDGLAELQRRYPFAKLHEIAEQCNLRKKSAHAAQIRSDEIFLGVYLQHHPTPMAEAVVIGVGEKSFSVLVLEFSLQARIFVDKIDVVSLNDSNFDVDSQELTLVHHQTGKQLKLTYMTPVRVRVYACVTPPPITVEVMLSEATFDM